MTDETKKSAEPHAGVQENVQDAARVQAEQHRIFMLERYVAALVGQMREDLETLQKAPWYSAGFERVANVLQDAFDGELQSLPLASPFDRQLMMHDVVSSIIAGYICRTVPECAPRIARTLIEDALNKAEALIGQMAADPTTKQRMDAARDAFYTDFEAELPNMEAQLAAHNQRTKQ